MGESETVYLRKNCTCVWSKICRLENFAILSLSGNFQKKKTKIWKIVLFFPNHYLFLPISFSFNVCYITSFYTLLKTQLSKIFLLSLVRLIYHISGNIFHTSSVVSKMKFYYMAYFFAGEVLFWTPFWLTRVIHNEWKCQLNITFRKITAYYRETFSLIIQYLTKQG